jgi:lysosomal acid lipase/cholesteryl ester hydrolase
MVHNDQTAYLLADAGYDVWLGNARGNTYSKRHVTLTTDDAEFWQFR